MSLKAIQQQKVGCMVEALNTLVELEVCAGKAHADGLEINDLKNRLLDKHQKYRELLIAIEAQINDFERLYRTLKMTVLPSKLKQLKTELHEDSVQFTLLKKVIQRTYRY